MRTTRFSHFVILIFAAFLFTPALPAAPRKPRVIALGPPRKVPYSKIGDPAGAGPNEKELKIRAFTIDGVLKEWTTGEIHEITERSFLVRRAIKLNDALPTDKSSKNSARGANPWVWQRGPWLLIDRITGHILALRLPDYDPGVSQVVWFRDYGAYCGLSANAKILYAVVAQVAGHKPLLAKKLDAFDLENHPTPVCALAEWQREPLGVTFHPTGKDAVSFEVAPGSAVLVEDNGDEDAPAAPQK
jgi:hypothetical protein